MTYYKVTSMAGKSCHGGDLQYSLPPPVGRWMPKINEIEIGKIGYHLCRSRDLVYWLNDAIWMLEIHNGAEVVDGDNIVVTTGPVRLVHRLPWDERIARHYACDCVERVLWIYEKSNPGDIRLEKCIDIARKYADGLAPQEEMDTTWTAAGDADRTAAGNADRTAAGNAAGNVARAAAWAAARAPAWDAARNAAWNAAWAMTIAAAGTATWDVAGAAERSWQTDHLGQILGINP